MVDQKPTAVCFSGLDPSGGAGLLRDLSVLYSHQIYVMAILTSETVQSSDECFEIQSPACAPSSIFSSLAPTLPKTWGAKLGLMAISVDELSRLMKELKQSPPQCLIWDPISGPTQGVGLHTGESLRNMAKQIGSARTQGYDWVISPNWDEFMALTSATTSMQAEELIHASKPILDYGFSSLWLKGGHGTDDQIRDYWITSNECHLIASHGRSQIKPRGTGCYLSSSWLAYRLEGMNGFESARQSAQDLQNVWLTSDVLPGSTRPILGLKK